MNMEKQLVALLLAGISGALMAIQGTWNSCLGKIIGFLEGTLVVQVTGAIVAGIAVLAIGNGAFSRANAVPWYAWLGGLVGVLIVLGVIASISSLGVGAGTTMIVTAQLLTACLIDAFGWCGVAKSPFSLLKMGGILLIAAGAKLLFSH